MPGKSEKTVQVGLRLPNKEHAQVKGYAAEHDLNMSQALLSLIRKGLAKPEIEPATKEDLQLALTAIQRAISEQPVQIQAALPEPETKKKWQFWK